MKVVPVLSFLTQASTVFIVFEITYSHGSEVLTYI